MPYFRQSPSSQRLLTLRALAAELERFESMLVDTQIRALDQSPQHLP
jgi:hypothetical protein